MLKLEDIPNLLRNIKKGITSVLSAKIIKNIEAITANVKLETKTTLIPSF